MEGTLVNCLAIGVGGVIGLSVGHRFHARFKRIAMQGIGLACLLIGLQLGFKSVSIMVLVASLVVGGVLGEWMAIESRLEKLAERLKSKVKGEKGAFVEGLVSASLLFCVGAMAILGSLEEGLKGNPSILYTKALLDGIATATLSSALGIGVLFAAIPVFLYQGAITLFASSLSPWLTPTLVDNLSAVGGLLIVGIGFNLLDLVKIRIGNMIPALPVAVLFSLFM